jgi:hypothetical protein
MQHLAAIGFPAGIEERLLFGMDRLSPARCLARLRAVTVESARLVVITIRYYLIAAE